MPLGSGYPFSLVREATKPLPHPLGQELGEATVDRGRADMLDHRFGTFEPLILLVPLFDLLDLTCSPPCSSFLLPHYPASSLSQRVAVRQQRKRGTYPLCRDGLRHFECDTNQIRTGDNTAASAEAGKDTRCPRQQDRSWGSGGRQRLFNLAVTRSPRLL